MPVGPLGFRLVNLMDNMALDKELGRGLEGNPLHFSTSLKWIFKSGERRLDAAAIQNVQASLDKAVCDFLLLREDL